MLCRHGPMIIGETGLLSISMKRGTPIVFRLSLSFRRLDRKCQGILQNRRSHSLLCRKQPAAFADGPVLLSILVVATAPQFPRQTVCSLSLLRIRAARSPL